jgi:tetratricopeptide (TPR) repeat protein
MFNLFKPKKKEINLIYPEIGVSKRIDKIVENFILPKIEHLGFKLLKSELKLVRNIGDFKQTIYIQKSRTNSADVSIKFKLIFIVEYEKYKKWFEKIYNEKLPNDYRINDNTLWATHDDIPNWGESLYSVDWYDLLKKDNYEIVNEINDKLINIAISYMDEFSNLESAIEKNINLESYTKTAMLLDFCKIINDNKKAIEIRDWYKLNVVENDIQLNEEVIMEIEKRIKNIKD